jgi:hypothetical protein
MYTPSAVNIFEMDMCTIQKFLFHVTLYQSLTVLVPMLAIAQGSMAVSPLWKVMLLERGRKMGVSGSTVTPLFVKAATQTQEMLKK